MPLQVLGGELLQTLAGAWRGVGQGVGGWVTAPPGWPPVQGLPLVLSQLPSPKLSPGWCGGWDEVARGEGSKVEEYMKRPYEPEPLLPLA